MGLEVGTTIADLVATNPLSTDKRRFGDDHLRLLKAVLKATFPNFTQGDGVVSSTPAEINFLAGVSDLIQTQLDAKVATDDLDALILAYEYATFAAANVWTATQALAPEDLGNVSGSTQLDLAVTDSYILTLVSDATLAFSGAQAGQSLTIKIIQGGSGDNLITWPGTIHWVNKTEPTLTTTLGDYDIVSGKQIGGAFVAGLMRNMGL